MSTKTVPSAQATDGEAEPKVTGVRLPVSLRQELAAEAKSADTTLSAVIIERLRLSSESVPAWQVELSARAGRLTSLQRESLLQFLRTMT